MSEQATILWLWTVAGGAVLSIVLCLVWLFGSAAKLGGPEDTDSGEVRRAG